MKKIALLLIPLWVGISIYLPYAYAFEPYPSPGVFHQDYLLEINHDGFHYPERKVVNGRDVVEFVRDSGSNPPIRIILSKTSYKNTAQWFKNSEFKFDQNNFKSWYLKTYVLDGDLNKANKTILVKEHKGNGNLYLVSPTGYLITLENMLVDDGQTYRYRDNKKLIKNMAKTLRFFKPAAEPEDEDQY